MKVLLITCAAILSFSSVHAQLLKKLANAAKARAEQKAVHKTEQAVDRGVDKATNVKTYKKDELGPKAEQNSKGDTVGTPASKATNFAAYTKFDFVSGEKIIVYEDFSQDSPGDFPSKWITNTSGEVVKVADKEGQWLQLQNTGVYMPEYINNLPENFTLEFEVMCNPEFRYSSSPLFIALASLKSAKDYVVWQEGWGGRTGVLTWILPTSSTDKSGRVGYRCYNKDGETWAEQETDRFHASTKNSVKVSIWRQKQRVRVYLDEEKVVDVARAFNAGDYNALVFSLNTQKTAPDQYLITNLRLAVGSPDTRNKLLSDGKFVTTGILFEVNSDLIEPSSYGILKEIASALKSDPAVRIRIVGHTDSDGESKANQDLSTRRAAAVKKALHTEFGIEEARMETAGMGEAAPVGDNKTIAGKAQNRRVEFIKL